MTRNLKTRPPIIRAFLDNEIVADNFAGGGGASSGLARALGRSPDIAINHDPEAIAMHAINHPDTRHYIKNVWEVDPVVACDGKPVAFAWFSPDCFPAGTLVLTQHGYLPIESVAVGDHVLTHRGRWRQVTETSSTRRPLMRLRGHGHPGLLVSPEHPFYARSSKRGANDWITASKLDDGCYWATPIAFPTTLRNLIPAVAGRGMVTGPELMWLAGRYLADGWTRLTSTRGELVISCGRHEVVGLREKLAAWPRTGERAGTNELAWSERDIPGVDGHGSYQFSTSHRGLVEWLREQFGHGSEFKSIPSWAFGMDRDLREQLLAGYVSGDGWRGEWTRDHGQVVGSIIEVTTVSKALAFSLKALACSLGFTVTVYSATNNGTIEGRQVNTLPVWKVKWRPALHELHRQTVREDHLEFTPIREVEHDVAADVQVFNIGVEDDESYVVEGIVVHNCKHFSKAKGGKPREQKIRGLAWVAVRWAQRVRPRIIALENVEEFRDWGPLSSDGRPIRERRGETFRAFVRKLVRLGYVVEHRLLRACDYGAPTSRRRLFLIARCDGQPIVWPEPTHGPGRDHPYRTAAECIDWSDLGQSIFERERPLADKTLARIARGIRKFVLGTAKPFVIPVNHGGVGRNDLRVHDLDAPMPTITGGQRGGHAVVSPIICKAKTHGGGGNDATTADQPLGTITTSKRGEFALAVPYLVHRSNGERPTKVDPDGTVHAGQAPRIYDAQEPLGTIMAQGQKHAACVAFLIKNNGGNNDRCGASGQEATRPLDTISSRDSKSLAVAHLAKFYGTSTGCSVEDPCPTITSGGGKGGGKLAQVVSFLVRYNGKGEPESAQLPLGTLTSKPRYGLITVTIDGEEYVLADIRMRMLSPRELFRAQGFDDDYQIAPEFGGKPLTKTAQIRMCGNSVPPDLAEAICRAQLGLPVRVEDRQAA